MNMQPNSNMGTSPEGKYHNNGYRKNNYNIFYHFRKEAFQ